MGIKHKKQTFAEDGTDPNAVHPSDWNDTHAIEGLLALLDSLTAAPDTFPVISADGSPVLASISAPALAMLSKATAAAMLAAIGGVSPDSPSFSGSPTAPTAALGTNNDRIATMAALQAMRADLTGGAPVLLDTLKELSDAIGADPNFSATIATALGNRLRVDVSQNLTPSQQLQAIANLALATVAVSGKYTDLSGSPASAGALASSQDLNLVTTPGTYYTIDATPVHAPSQSFLTLVVTIGTGLVVTQWATISNSTLTYVRSRDYTGAWSVWQQVIALDAAGKLPAVDGSQLLNVSGYVSYLVAQGLTAAQKTQARANMGAAPSNSTRTRKIVASGSGTYTTPAGCTAISVRMVGGGGGGGGGGDGASGGGAGTATTFGASFLVANGGGGGGVFGNGPAVGGAAGGGDINAGGATSSPTDGAGGSTATLMQGKNGASSTLGGGGYGGWIGAAGGAAPANTGSGGGGGGGSDGGANGRAATGGGSGGFVEKLITAPAASYAYAVGAGGNGGAAGANGSAGGAGAAGIIIIDEFY